MHFSDSSEYQDFDARQKTAKFSMEDSGIISTFLVERRMNWLSFVFPEVKSATEEKLNSNCAF